MHSLLFFFSCICYHNELILRLWNMAPHHRVLIVNKYNNLRRLIPGQLGQLKHIETQNKIRRKFLSATPNFDILYWINVSLWFPMAIAIRPHVTIVQPTYCWCISSVQFANLQRKKLLRDEGRYNLRAPLRLWVCVVSMARCDYLSVGSRMFDNWLFFLLLNMVALVNISHNS